jgi:hypothetical protein
MFESKKSNGMNKINLQLIDKFIKGFLTTWNFANILYIK